MGMRITNAVLMIALLGAVAGCAGGKVVQKGPYHVWPPETSHTYQFTEEQTLVMSMAPETVTKTTVTATVRSTGTPREYQVHLDDATRSVSMGDGGQEADDEGNEEGVAKPRPGALPQPLEISGAEFTMHLDEGGHITELTGLEDSKALEEFGGGEWIQHLMQPVFFDLPEGGTIARGAKWAGDPEAFTLEVEGVTNSVKVNENFQCMEETLFNKHPAYRISTTSNVGVEAAGEQMGNEFHMTASGMLRGPAFVDMATGRLLKAESQGSLEGRINMMGMEMPVELRLNNRVEAKS